tara:strand:+ start:11747 stop:12670 length:924 start_codon:yes stop_codon:yes gene_type:complete
MRDTFAEELESLISEDSNIIFLTGDLGFGVFDSLRKNYPQNFINIGVAEQNMTGIATGLAMEGFKVFTYSIANFSTLRCLEQIRNDASYHELNVNVVSVGGGFSYGPLGMSHHATEDLAIMRSMPGVTVISPGTLLEAKHATRQIINQPGVGYLRIDKSHFTEDKNSSINDFKIGQAIRYKEGDDISLFTTGGILEEAMEAAKELNKLDINTRVISFHTIKPIDKNEINAAIEETGGIITVEEHNVIGGLGGAIAEACLENSNRPKIFKRIGLNDTFSSIVGSQKHLREKYYMDSKAIVETVQNLLD